MAKTWGLLLHENALGANIAGLMQDDNGNWSEQQQ